MQTLTDLIQSGRIVDIMLVVVAIEVAVLLAYRKVTGKGLRPLALLLNIGAGGSLMVALKLVFIDAGWQWVAVALISALVFHVSDLALRWQQTAKA
ncbi:MAG: hypothetical protein AAF270_06625 [Pseudomonadota bacterium]